MCVNMTVPYSGVNMLWERIVQFVVRDVVGLIKIPRARKCLTKFSSIFYWLIGWNNFMVLDTNHMKWHHTSRSNDGLLRHPVDGDAWKNFDILHSNFVNEPRNVRLGLVVDGFNRFDNLSLSYSMWPLVFTT